MEISQEILGSVYVLAPAGRLDTDSAADFELAVQDLLGAKAQHFVVDLAGVSYVSSAGLRVLLMLAKAVDGSGSLRLCGLNPQVKQVFDIAGFTRLFALYADRAAAMAGHPQGGPPAAPPRIRDSRQTPAVPKDARAPPAPAAAGKDARSTPPPPVAAKDARSTPPPPVAAKDARSTPPPPVASKDPRHTPPPSPAAPVIPPPPVIAPPAIAMGSETDARRTETPRATPVRAEVPPPEPAPPQPSAEEQLGQLAASLMGAPPPPPHPPDTAVLATARRAALLLEAGAPGGTAAPAAKPVGRVSSKTATPAPAGDPEPTPAGEKKPGFFSRLFGRK